MSGGVLRWPDQAHASEASWAAPARPSMVRCQGGMKEWQEGNRLPVDGSAFRTGGSQILDQAVGGFLVGCSPQGLVARL